MAYSFTPWQYNTPFGAPAPGTAGPGPGPQPVFRDLADQLRSGYNRLPGADYPDGYLGTIRTRRDDRVLQAVKDRTGRRSYTRGVHKGERIDSGDYYWDGGEATMPMEGVVRQATTGLRHTPTMEAPVHLTNDGRAGPVTSSPGVIDPERQARMANLRPRWV